MPQSDRSTLPANLSPDLGAKMAALMAGGLASRHRICDKAIELLRDEARHDRLRPNSSFRGRQHPAGRGARAPGPRAGSDPASRRARAGRNRGELCPSLQVRRTSRRQLMIGCLGSL